MDVKKQFDFLVKNYGLIYKYQEFHNCYGGNWLVYTHSFYNDSGCFTIHNMPSRGELAFYYAEKFSNILEELYEQELDVRIIEKEIWDKHTKFLCFVKPFFWWSDKKVLNALTEVLKVHIDRYGEFFGIKVKKR